MRKTRRALLCAFVTLPCAGLAPAGAHETPSLAEVFARVNPAVVEIHTTEQDLPPTPASLPVSVAGLGSGVLISPDGKVLTAAHVVQTASSIQVEFLSGEVIGARVLSSEPLADVAVLQLEAQPTSPVVASLGDSDAVQIGAPVFVVGAPLGASHTLTAGHISARRRPKATFSGISLAEFFQTDASINQGNSGGPLFNMHGEVIGIVSHILSRSGGSEGLGFAVTTRVARQLLEQKSFWSGVNGYLLVDELAQVFNVPPPGVGLMIQQVAAGSPADQLGLKGGIARATIGEEELAVGGDIILSILGISFDQPEALGLMRKRITELGPGEQISMVVLRGGRTITLSAPAPARP